MKLGVHVSLQFRSQKQRCRPVPRLSSRWFSPVDDHAGCIVMHLASPSAGHF
ncbi:hypothetical protein PAMC26510_30735 [Caballeronia sordidicola]|uniref:Uncharacterized protein n=1 Tax=Caballeronia sordidicola TaxID=196367 RepID=A0A242M8J5_CABSO|nr:hypothetical protein PAMC26510_30735 [Caballeronia sordidicola]OTP71437.1 hypothetical protein PAMC26577_23590 [Caballeronia sordidicola]